ncbi:long-chain fatty acid transport protein 2-like [Asterias amurensis]|uniref:long-chain fatty acid transport protein 2-like n=1 Tax=Asterias amurensis TaxID=7602 RepID=UPI003AB54213
MSDSRKVAKAVAASLTTGIPVALASYLRLKYGPTVFQDIVEIMRTKSLERTQETLQQRGIKLMDFFEEHAQKTPEKAFVLYKDGVHTYGDLDKEANKLARFLHRRRTLTCGDTAAIFMMNEPSFILTWLAFNKLGLKIAFLNYNLRGDALLHGIRACKVKAITCGKDKLLIEALDSIMAELDATGVEVLVIGKVSPEGALPDRMTHVDTWNERSDPIPRSVRDELPNDVDALYIFTSGTTGLPKPANLSHNRQTRNSFLLSKVDLTHDDVMYTSLPLYHSAAYTLGLTNVVRVGGTIAISTFSASRFWDDIRKYRATGFQYIGEICRYLLAQPLRPDDGQHRIRFALGNGLRSDIWKEFQERFNISHVAEFYGATEAPYLSMNMDGKVGSVGRYHGINRDLTHIFDIVRCDVESAQPLRGVDGKCIPTPPGETGLMLVRLNKDRQFEGYLADKATNEKKLVRNVKNEDDVFFNTGDLMTHDVDGQLYFKDRLGDTFRWKGENVATTEVAHVLNEHPDVQEANVYGVRVPGHDGKAGMAAIVIMKGHRLDLHNVYSHVVKSLPLYACPKFLRVLTEMDITVTFKHRKTDLAKEGFDLNVISDPLFFLDTERKTYVPLTNDVISKLVVGQARL